MEIHCVLKVESLENEEKNTQNEMEVVRGFFFAETA